MVLKLYGNPNSTCTKRVAVVLHEKKVPFEFVVIDFAKGEHKTPEYLTRQPFGQVPYLDDDGFILYESRAIGRYIATKYASQGTPGLIPTDLKKQALFEQAASVETSNLTRTRQRPYLRTCSRSITVSPPIQRRSSLDWDSLNQTGCLRPDLEQAEELTLADLFHLPYGAMLEGAGSDIIQQKPNVARWFNEIASLPSWQAVKGGVTSVASYA
ncbi:thioredoxin-like protein [Cyathus striatus]|nr:thioredoxin-like protein [Cyathus striatus]